MSNRRVSYRSDVPRRYPTCGGESTSLYGNPPRYARPEREPQVQVATASNSRPKVNEDYGGVETEEVKFEGLTVTLLVVIDNASVPQAKARMLEITARTIKDGPGNWSQKGRLLGQRLEYAIAERSAQGDIQDLKICTSIAFSYQDSLLKRADGALLVVGTPPTAPQLRQVTFLEFVLVVAPSVLPKFRTSKIKPKSITAALRILKVAGVVTLPRAVFADPARLIAVIITATGQQPEFLRLGAALGGRLEIDEEAVETALAEKQAENPQRTLAKGRSGTPQPSMQHRLRPQ